MEILQANQENRNERSKKSESLNSEGPTLTINHASLCKDSGTNEYGFNALEAVGSPKSASCEPIAIVGMGLRLPGGVNSPEEFWKFLIEKRDGLCEVPETRYNLDSFYSESKPHFVKTRKGYFLQDDPAYFDADFFSIMPYEAERMDPQQRQLMEVVWECLESAGETNWRGKEIGCFVGVYGEDWLELASKDPQSTDRYHVLGTGQFALSNRVSYEYDFQGPSGICRTFDEKADGYGRGEAINAIYIKPLRDAIKNGDPVRGVIRATSTNCDGHTPSITTPGSISQERLIRKAYAKAKIADITQTAFFECHGTGTTAGDTAETSVVAKIFEEKGTIVGSVKPNVGHSEGASGVTSVIKAALALENKRIPPNIYFDAPNPNIPFKQANIQVPTDMTAWPKDRKERVSVNCFGIGGANAHVIMESMTAYCSQVSNPPDSRNLTSEKSHLLVVSAMCHDSLQQRIQGVIRYANEHPDLLLNLAYTLGERRQHMSHRAFAVATASKPIDTSNFQTSQEKSADLVFVFTGQGAQWPGMGKDLMDTFESFRKDIQDMDSALQELEDSPNWSLQEIVDELVKVSDSRVSHAAYSQPLCTAVQIGIVNILRRMGGSAVICSNSAVIIAYYRGKAIEGQDGKGEMVAIGLGRESISPYMEDGAVLACENSPENITLSGDIEVIRRITAKVKNDFPDTLCRPLRVKTAYHSHHMLEVGISYEPSLKNRIEFNSSMLPLFSSVNSAKITNPRDLDAAYWRQNLQSPVLFSDAIKSSFKHTDQGLMFLEIGPHSALAGPLRQIFKSVAPKKDPVYIPTMTRYVDDSRSQLLHTLGCIHANGGIIDFSAANGKGQTLTNLPTYPWLHKSRHWHESRLASEWRQQKSPHHEILGTRVTESSDLEPSWRNILRLQNVPWIWDHVLQGNVMFPAAGYIAMVGEAIHQLFPDTEDYSIKNLSLKSPLLMRDEQEVEIFTTLRRVKYNDTAESEWYAFTVTAFDGTGWTKHCQGQVRSGYDYPPPMKEIKKNIRTVNADQWYRRLSKYGVSYGPSFRGLKDIFAHPVERIANATVIDPTEYSSRYTMHPIVIDQTLQLLSVATVNGVARRIDRFAIPAAIGHVYIAGHASEMQIESQMAQNESGVLFGSSSLMADGVTLLSLNQATFFTVQDEPVIGTSTSLISEIRWTPDIDFTPAASWLTMPTPSTEIIEYFRDVSRISFAYILETASRVASSTPKELHMVNYKNWLTEEADRILSGTYSKFSQESECVSIPMSPDDRMTVIQDFLLKYENHESLSNLPAPKAVFDNCVALVSGTKSSIETLMEDDRLHKYYDTLESVSMWTEYLQLLGNTNPLLRILEVGAGTGGATRDILQSLKSKEGVCLYSKYVFTDISPGFTISAQEEFAENQNIEFKVLDISRDVKEQGFETHLFDLVIASNVLHATPSLNATLRNVHSLLAPNGKLLLQEMCPVTQITPFIMGTLPGWWIGKDDQRADRPYVSPERWDRELQAAGFTGSEAFANDFAPPFQHNFSMISGIAAIDSPTKRNISLVLKMKPNNWAVDFASQLSQKGHLVEWDTLEGCPPTDRDLILLLDIDEPFLHGLEEGSFTQLQEYMLKATGNRMIWVTHSSQMACSDPRYGLILGFSRTLRRELGIDISIFETDTFDASAISSLCSVYDKITSSRDADRPNPEYEFSYYQGSVHIGRCHWGASSEAEANSLEVTERSVRKLDIGSVGFLDSIHWTHCPEETLEDEQIEIDMRHIGLNFRDLMVAMGLVGHKEQLGFEGSGVVRRVGLGVKDFSPGDRVIAFYQGILKTRIAISSKRCFPCPDEISLIDAASLPTVYATAIYSLIEVSNLRKDQSVLIHSACGGVGLASIQICKNIGAEIFATVGSEEKVQYLMTEFGIPRNHIFNSRNNTFLPDLMRETNGRGADVVLNSLAELGKRDFLTNGTLSMTPFAGNRAFYGVDLLSLAEESPEFVRKIFAHAMELCEQRKIKPIRPVKSFPANRTTDAFRYMQQGVHMGKIVIDIPENIQDLDVSQSVPVTSFSSKVSYLLVGGLGGMGRAISTWMVENGARYLVFLSRSAGETEDDQVFIRELETQGCHVTVVRGSVVEFSDVQNAVASCIKPLGGVMQLSVKLSDRTFENMSFDDWTSCLAPKVTGTWNLHRAVEKENLDFFVVFGSLTGVVGNTGQINYSAANTFLDSFTQYRRNLGLASSAIALGPVEDVGIVSRSPEILHTARVMWSHLLDESEVIEGLKAAVDRSAVRNTDQNALIIVGLTASHSQNPESSLRPIWDAEGRYSLHHNMKSTKNSNAELQSDHLRMLIAQAEENPAILDDPETEALIRREMGKLITQHMATAKDMDDEQIANIAVDSLMSIEIRGWIRRNLELEISLAEISKAGTVGSLATLAVDHLRAKYNKH
ncbi:Fum1p [Penicillium verhagenii]|nr:Fum1p [Penicillium verhagenii]